MRGYGSLININPSGCYLVISPAIVSLNANNTYDTTREKEQAN